MSKGKQGKPFNHSMNNDVWIEKDEHGNSMICTNNEKIAEGLKEVFIKSYARKQ